MTETPKPAAPLLAWLRERNDDVREIEAEAHAALHDRQDEVTYRDLMKKKAVLLSTIAADAAARFITAGGSPTAYPASAQTRLASFAAGAKNALRIDSVFYMSALLYPDDHRPGEPNNLERLIAEIAAAPNTPPL